MKHKKMFFLSLVLLSFFIIHKRCLIGANLFTESLSDLALRNKLRTHFKATPMAIRTIAKRKKIPLNAVTKKDIDDYYDGELGPVQVDPSEEDYIDIRLNGRLYKVVGGGAGGEEGRVYHIKDATGKKFALKVWDYGKGIEGDLLALNKARKSRAFLNTPIEVNTQHKYSIFPLLAKPYSVTPNPVKLEEVQKKLDAALAEDGLEIGDNHNGGNYMYDEHDNLWRVDFGSLKQIQEYDFSANIEK